MTAGKIIGMKLKVLRNNIIFIGMLKNTEHEDIITYILIGLGLGVPIGFVLKVFLDTYAIVERLPL